MATPKEVLEVGDREVTITNPAKVYFPKTGHTKLDVVRYYLATAEGVLGGVRGRPMALKRYVNGVESEPFYQKRAPDKRPEWIETVELTYPSGRSAHEVVVREAAPLAWLANLGCVDLHPHPVRAEDLEHPDELRVDLDPIPGVPWSDVRQVALVVREVLTDYGLVGWPKTSGSRGMHVYVRIRPEWTFTELRRAAYALAREVEERAPDLATSRWWKEERHGVFVDYNQNAKDHTTVSAYSIRPTEDARVSTPLFWEEVADCEPAAFTIDTVPDRLAALGDPAAGLDEAAGSLHGLLELGERHQVAGLVDPAVPGIRAPGRRSTRAGATKAGATKGDGDGDGAGVRAAAPPGKSSGASGRRRSVMPLVEISRAASKEEALAGLDRWRERHFDIVEYLEPPDILVDQMRGRSTAWFRVRVNLIHVPAEQRPEQEALEVDYDPWAALKASGAQWPPGRGEPP
jgi:bifunctional non-homologous end joining protein LigD